MEAHEVGEALRPKAGSSPREGSASIQLARPCMRAVCLGLIGLSALGVSWRAVRGAATPVPPILSTRPRFASHALKLFALLPGCLPTRLADSAAAAGRLLPAFRSQVRELQDLAVASRDSELVVNCPLPEAQHWESSLKPLPRIFSAALQSEWPTKLGAFGGRSPKDTDAIRRPDVGRSFSAATGLSLTMTRPHVMGG